jgi:transcriptional regulator with XRE-family HTH domain
MIVNLQELLALAKRKGLTDRQIAKITGRNYTTIWRWKQNKKKDFVFDSGIRKLIKALGDDK